MTTLAQRLAPHMTGTLTHPGDQSTEPFPLAPIPAFTNTATMPKGMAEDMAQQAGLPHPNFALIYCEAWLALLENIGGVTLVPNAELAELRAELAQWRAIAEPKANEMKTINAVCGAPAGRVMARGLHTDQPVFPCEMVIHDCKGKR